MHKFGLATPHTSHCSPEGEIIISTMGTPSGEANSDFLCIDSDTLEVKGTWIKSKEKGKFGYDFWYQPHHDIVVATEWGTPRVFKRGYSPNDPINEGMTFLPNIGIIKISFLQLIIKSGSKSISFVTF